MAVPFGPQILLFLFFFYVKRQLNEFVIEIAEHFLITTMRMLHRFLTEGQRRQTGFVCQEILAIVWSRNVLRKWALIFAFSNI